MRKWKLGKPKKATRTKVHFADWFKARGRPHRFMDMKPLLVVFLFSTSMLAGCFGEDEVASADSSSVDVYPEPWDRSDLTYNDQDI